VGEASLSLYGAAGRLARPLAGAWLTWRERQGREDGSRRGERFGIASRDRPDGPLIWVHASSVGETVAALPLIRRLVERGPTVLLTTATVTAAQVQERRLDDVVIHQYVPIDTPAAIGGFLDHWRPNLAIFVESELWPTTLKALAERQVPLVVVNARMSERSFRGWRALAPLARTLLGSVSLTLPQSLADAERLRALGAGNVVVCGNLKFDAPPPPADVAVLAELEAAIGDRPVLLAASTHAGEEAAIIAAHVELRRSGMRLLTILAPRHPGRGEELEAEAAAAGLKVARRSRGAPVAPDSDIYLADTIGEMGLWYRLADVAFLGGSMVPHGGQNPIEPAKLRVPVLHGEHVGNFRDVYAALAEAKAVITVTDGPSLAAAARLLLEDRRERERLAREAFACVERFTGALERTLGALEPYVAPLSRDDAVASRA
jgi:3-deoxy-D-manno-octulosonic-acid transferase